MANGPLHRPKLPGIPASRRSRATRSTPAAGTTPTPAATPTATSTGLRDKRVGIIGTGATAVQCVPHLGAAAEQLYVFQRTPSSIDVRDNRPTDPEWAASLEPGWQQQRMDNFNILVSGGFQDEDLVERRLDRHHPQAARRWCSEDERADLSPDGIAADDGARRLREDGADPRARRRDRRRPGDRRGAEAVLPPVLQAAVLPRRVPRHVQPAERHAGRHQGPRRRAHHRAAASSSTASSTRSTA